MNASDNPYEHLDSVTGLPFGFRCGACARDHALRESAVACCANATCGCGAAVPRRGDKCAACRAKDHDAMLRRRFETATKIALGDYAGRFLCFDDKRVGREGYIETTALTDALGALKDADGPRPTFAWACDETVASFDVEDAVRSHIEDNHHEDAFDSVGSLDAAQALVNEAINGVRSYFPDYELAVTLP